MGRTPSVILNNIYAPTGNPSTATSGSVTIPAFSVLVAWVQWVAGGDCTSVAGSFSNTTSPLVWTKKAASKNAGPFFGYFSAVEMFVAANNSAAPITTTLKTTKALATPSDPHVVFRVIAVTADDDSIDFADLWGATAEYLQTDYTYPSPNASWGAVSANFSATIAADSLLLASLATSDQDTNNSSSAPGAGWTELADFISTSGFGAIATEYKENPTVNTMVWADCNESTINHLWMAAGLGIELKKKAAGGGAPVTFNAASLVGGGTLPTPALNTAGLTLNATTLIGGGAQPEPAFNKGTLQLTPASIAGGGAAQDATLNSGPNQLIGQTAVGGGAFPIATLDVGPISFAAVTSIGGGTFPDPSVSLAPLVFTPASITGSGLLQAPAFNIGPISLAAGVLSGIGVHPVTALNVGPLQLPLASLAGSGAVQDAQLQGGDGFIVDSVVGVGVIGAHQLIIGPLGLGTTTATTTGVVSPVALQVGALPFTVGVLIGSGVFPVPTVVPGGIQLSPVSVIGGGAFDEALFTQATIFAVDSIVGQGVAPDVVLQLGPVVFNEPTIVGVGAALDGEITLDPDALIEILANSVIGQGGFGNSILHVGFFVRDPLLPYIKVTALFEAVKTLLDSEPMAQLLGGPHRVYRVDQDVSKPEGRADAPWGRLVIVPTTNIWGENPQPTLYRTVSFLLRAEFNPYVSPGYDVSYILEAVHSYCLTQLEGFAPVLSQSLVSLPVYLETPASAGPLWDDGRRLWFSSAEYRCEVAYKVNH